MEAVLWCCASLSQRGSVSHDAGIVHTLLPYLIGAAITLAVQIVIQYIVVPRVEARKRRENRWETNVDAFTELLTFDVSQRAYDARFEQTYHRTLRARSGTPGYDPERIARGLHEQERKAWTATYSFMDLLHTRYMLIFRRIALWDSPHMASFALAAMQYHLTALGLGGWSADDERSDEAFDQLWEAERSKRYEVIEEATKLAERSRPPARARFSATLSRLGRKVRRARTWAGQRLGRARAWAGTKLSRIRRTAANPPK